MMIRNPWKTVGLAVTVFIGIPGIATSGMYLRSAAEPIWPATHPWVLDKLTPISALQKQHDFALEYLIQQDARRALDAAKADMARSPNATTQHAIEQLEKSINERQQRLDKIGR